MRLLRLSLLVVLSVSLLAHSLAAPGSAGRDVLAMYKFDLGSLLETQETEDSAQHQAQLHQLESFLTADDEDEEGAEAGQVQAEEAAEMWSAAEGEESSETVAAATPSNAVQDGTVSKKDGNPYDDLVSIFSALGDKDAVANSQKILNSALTMHSSLNTPSEEAATPAAAAAVAEPQQAQQAQASTEAEESHESHEAAGQEESSEETEDALPLVAAAEDSETATPVSEGPITRTPVPDTPVPDTPTRAPAPVQNRTDPVPTQAPTPPPAPKFVTLNYVKPVYDDAPNPISPDYEVKAVQGRGGWKKANKVAKDTLGPCNKGDPCPPQPTADNPNPAPTQLQLNKIRADAEIQKHFGDKRVLEPQGWIRPTHAGCEGDCPKIEVSQSTSDGKFVTANSIPSLPVEVRLNCEPKLEGQC